MKRRVVVAGVTLCTLLSLSPCATSFQPQTSAGTQQDTQGETQSSTHPLSDNDILEMVKAGLSPEIVVAKIKSGTTNFDTSPNQLEQFKKDAVPDSVILAMVQATTREVAEGQGKPLGTITAQCAPGQTAVHIFDSPTPRSPWESQVVTAVDCGQKLTLLAKSPTGERVRTEDGKEGYIVFALMLPRSSAQEVTMIRTLGYRVTAAPWTPPPPTYHTTTTGTANCNTFGSSTNCQIDTEQYTTQDNSAAAGYALGRALFNQQVYIYNFGEGGGYFFAIACERKAAWSKCSKLQPGGVFGVTVTGDQMGVLAYKNGNLKKPEHLNYKIVWAVPEQK